MSYVLTQLASDWDSLTAAQREALFEGTNYNTATLAELQTLGAFKVLLYSDNSSGSAENVVVNGVHNDFLVLPKTLFGSTFSSIEAIAITEDISDTTNAKIRYVLTKDLTTYYAYSNGAWTALETVDADTVISDGMSSDDLEAISSSEWAEFYDGDGNGIGIGFAFHETATSQTTAIDNLALTATMQGMWYKAEHTADYTYGYTNNTLQVKLLTDGSYKINYGSTGGGSSSDPDSLTAAQISTLVSTLS